MYLRKVLIILLLFLFNSKLFAQNNIVFQHLNTSNGLSYLGVNSMCFDQQGNLWIATGDGLNMFNGRAVDKYFSSEYPQLQNNNHTHILCDGGNRIWVLSYDGYVTMLDEKRQFHRVSLYDNNKRVRIGYMMKKENETICLYTSKGNYTFANTAVKNNDPVSNKQFDFLPLVNYTEQGFKGRNTFYSYDNDHYLLFNKNAFLKISFKTNKVERRYDFTSRTALIKWKSNGLLVYNELTREVELLNLDTETISYPFRNLTDQDGKKIEAVFNFAEKINEHKYVFSTEGNGVYVYDNRVGTISNYTHNYFTQTSLGNDIARNMAVDNKGWVFIACLPHGISYFNATDVISNQVVFSDRKGTGYDGVIYGINTRDNANYYIGTANGIMKWNRKTNTTGFINVPGKDGESVFGNTGVISLLVDKYDRVWATASSNGIVVLNKEGKLVKQFIHDPLDPSSLKVKMPARLILGPDGYVWTCGRSGFCRINPDNLEVDNLQNTPLKVFDSLHVVPLLFTDKDNLLIAASFDGLYHYNFSTRKLEEHSGYKKYRRSGILDLSVDIDNNIYIGNRDGLFILFRDGRINVLKQKDGMLMDRVEGLLTDIHNRMWIGNDIGLVCYGPSDSSLKAFDVRYGLSIYGFRVGSYFKMPNGEFFFGTPKGLQYFHPDSLYNKKMNPHVSITKFESKQIVSSVTNNASFSLKAKDNQVTFYFGTVDFSPQLRTYYEYKLVDLDKDWIKATDQNSVRYNSLPPGKYAFKVRVSNDNKNWQESDNEVTIIVATPFYQAWWFKILGVLLGLFLIWYVFKYYQRKQLKQKEELEAQVVINYFASQINRHLKTEDILWDVAKNCISKLNFEDCVIYLHDEERNVLVQKAAWGPKLAKDLTIHQPIEIPIGEGIVGSVAQTGKPELIVNTELDKRYIADDAHRFSELAVPLIINKKVIGVIDSEHSRKNFFTKRHLNILSTVAVLCATQIERAKAEQEEHEAQLVIDYFASQIHSRYNSDELLWDLAKNLIGKLEFEDCMIYLWNEDRSVLVQKAGYGIKGSMQEIIDRTAYHIPKGKGIVGATVEAKQSILINDTSKDDRYFTADGKIMLSELCVPLIHNNEVLGAINTEHPARNFYTARHLKMLSTIADLCAGQLKRIRAEEEKQQAKIELLENKRRAMESRLQSLRLQMNPHFLFNALNSVQQMILANEEMIATKYLSKFSKLLRSILVHSDKETVTLKEEIEVLKLYVELESIRFKESFRYEIVCDEDIDVEEVKIPTLLIQPFVENAIWHGLMHKEGDRVLKVQFFEEKEFIQCVVEDNGIGRQKAKEMKITTGQDKKHTSKGIQVSEERLRSMQCNGTSGSIEIKDLMDGSDKPSGTRIEIYFPTKSY